jgi:hypothetical protein
MNFARYDTNKNKSWNKRPERKSYDVAEERKTNRQHESCNQDNTGLERSISKPATYTIEKNEKNTSPCCQK